MRTPNRVRKSEADLKVYIVGEFRGRKTVRFQDEGSTQDGTDRANENLVIAGRRTLRRIHKG